MKKIYLSSKKKRGSYSAKILALNMQKSIWLSLIQTATRPDWLKNENKSRWSSAR